MHFVPILSTLRRHRIAASLIVLEIALTCAIVCNAVFLIGERIGRIHRPSGVAEAELVRIQLTGIGKGTDAKIQTAIDLEALASVSGVRSATVVDMVPFGNSSWNNTVSTVRDDPDPPVSAAVYVGGQHQIETFGTTLVRGRDFTPDEFVDMDAMQAGRATIPSAIITQGVADRLFPGKDPLGQALYAWGEVPQTVVGVVDRIARPNEGEGAANRDYAMFLPITMSYADAGNYILRVDPSRQGEVLAAASAALEKANPNRIFLERQTFAEIRAKYFEKDRAMAWLLVGVCVALLVVTALGIVGLASFWVQQRTRQIGIRRALGATRGQIVRYFQIENFILATLGIGLGMIMAYGINLWLMDKYHVARLPAVFLPTGAIVLWLLGQIAVLGPALRAAAVPPAVATRTV